jgi:hypothetical protein
MAYHIWGTIGVDYFITRQGAVIKCEDENVSKAVQITDQVEFNAALTASLANVAELAELLPERTLDALPCPDCRGIGQRGILVICETCKSLGWIVSRT